MAVKMSAIVVWMAIWWITEAVPIPVTSIIPVFLFPFLGIMDTKSVAVLYMNDVIFLFIGGFIIAFAMERWNLHKRIALKILLSLKGTPTRILFGFMFVSYFLSMWISNTATVLMLLPAVLAIILQVEQFLESGKDEVATGFLLGLAYAASIGGTATLVGTPPNLIFMNFYQNTFPDETIISFGKWFLFGVPVSFVFLIIAHYVLKKIYMKHVTDTNISMASCQKAYDDLGKFSYEEKVVGIIFMLTAFLWLFRLDIDIGICTIPGWSNLFIQKEFLRDSTVAVVMAVLLFLIPSRQKKNDMIMNWNEVKRLPFGIILLFGGGFALAKGFEISGLSDILASNLSSLNILPEVLIILGLCTFMTFFTEFTSNTASIQLMLPVIFALTKSIDVHPLLFMIPITFSASFAFMLPIATPPNTIIFGSDRIKIKDMARTGVILNIIGVILITLAMLSLGKLIFDIP